MRCDLFEVHFTQPGPVRHAVLRTVVIRRGRTARSTGGIFEHMRAAAT
jgi:hypothetical protein